MEEVVTDLEHVLVWPEVGIFFYCFTDSYPKQEKEMVSSEKFRQIDWCGLLGRGGD